MCGSPHIPQTQKIIHKTWWVWGGAQQNLCFLCCPSVWRSLFQLLFCTKNTHDVCLLVFSKVVLITQCSCLCLHCSPWRMPPPELSFALLPVTPPRRWGWHGCYVTFFLSQCQCLLPMTKMWSLSRFVFCPPARCHCHKMAANNAWQRTSSRRLAFHFVGAQPTNQLPLFSSIILHRTKPIFKARGGVTDWLFQKPVLLCTQNWLKGSRIWFSLYISIFKTVWPARLRSPPPPVVKNMYAWNSEVFQ